MAVSHVVNSSTASGNISNFSFNSGIFTTTSVDFGVLFIATQSTISGTPRWDAVSMSALASFITGTFRVYLFGIIAPASDVTIDGNFAGMTHSGCFGAVYTGVDQSTSTSDPLTIGNSTTSPLTNTHTLDANDMVVGVINGGAVQTVASGTTQQDATTSGGNFRASGRSDVGGTTFSWTHAGTSSLASVVLEESAAAPASMPLFNKPLRVWDKVTRF